MKFGDVVIYSEGGEEYNAIVLGEREGHFQYRDGGALVSADHKGKNGEPLLTLVFAKQRLDAAKQPLPIHGTGQTESLAQFRLDVAHESHEYTDKQKKQLEKTAYDGGRWREVPPQKPDSTDKRGAADPTSKFDLALPSYLTGSQGGTTQQGTQRRMGDRAPRPETPAEEESREAREEARRDAEDVQP
jgi:hypothetical protein